jgi:hypothetical protein
MSLYYSLARELSGEKLLHEISNMINKFMQNNGDMKNSILVVEIHSVSDNSGDSLIPKIQYKNINDCTT